MASVTAAPHPECEPCAEVTGENLEALANTGKVCGVRRAACSASRVIVPACQGCTKICHAVNLNLVFFIHDDITHLVCPCAHISRPRPSGCYELAVTDKPWSQGCDERGYIVHRILFLFCGHKKACVESSTHLCKSKRRRERTTGLILTSESHSFFQDLSLSLLASLRLSDAISLSTYVRIAKLGLTVHHGMALFGDFFFVGPELIR